MVMAIIHKRDRIVSIWIDISFLHLPTGPCKSSLIKVVVLVRWESFYVD